MRTLNYGTTTIVYTLHQQQRSDLKVTVTLVNGVDVYAPKTLSDADITRYLQQKAPWIQQKIQSLNQINTQAARYEFLSGEKLPYLGRHYRLKIHRRDTTACQLHFYQGWFIADVPQDLPQADVRQALEQQLVSWYRSQATKQLHKRAAYYASLLGVTPNSLQIRTQHKRWGTCTPSGDIYINWRLIMAPSAALDYVIVHELAHLKIQDHSPAFWKTIKSILPNYAKQTEWLRINGKKLYSIG